jgi:hypothetical protein
MEEGGEKGAFMGATLHRDERGILVLHVSGALRKEEMDAVQAKGIEELGPDEDARVLVMVDADFRGWVGDEVWGDMTFFIKHGDRIEKIAIVGDPWWESRMLMFAGAGFRRAPVKYFATDRISEAYSWLA